MEGKKFTQIVSLVDKETAERFKKVIYVTEADRKAVLSEIVTQAIKDYNTNAINEFNKGEKK